MNLNVRIQPITNPKGKLVAFATLEIENAIYVQNFRVVNGSQGYFASPPSSKSNKINEETGKPIYFDDVRFSDEEIRREVLDMIVDAYQQHTGTGGGNYGETMPKDNNEARSKRVIAENW